MDKIKQKQIACFLGVSEPFVSEIRSGVKGISKRRAKMLSESINIPFENLMLSSGEKLYQLLVFAYQQGGQK